MNKLKTLFKLKPVTKVINDYYTFDVETKGLRGQPDAFIFGVIYSNNFTKIIHSVSDFKAEFLKPRYKGKKVFAHNAEYDLSTIYGNIYDMDKTAIFNGKFICATNGNCTFADSMNIFPTSLKNLGELIGKNKLDLNSKFIDGSILKSDISINEIQYCIRDCEITYDVLHDAFNFAGQIAITQAALSMQYFRRHHLNLNINHNPKETAHFFKSYYGGRTEMFKKGKVRAYVEDVNSMYPYVMANSIFPNPATLTTITQNSTKNRDIIRFLSILEKFEGTATLNITHKKNWIGYLPFKRDGKLIFPVGTFTGSWNFPEIRKALNDNMITINKVFSFTFAPPIKTPFKSFVDTLYKLRYESNNKFEIFRIKIYLNSLYGKFAQRIKENSIYLDDIFSDENMKIIEQSQKDKTYKHITRFNYERVDGFLIVKSKQEIQSDTLSYCIPSYSSYITSIARVMLLDKLIKSKKYNPVYCDTDSVFLEITKPNEKTSIKHTSNIPILGQWSLEDKTISEIIGLKNYKFSIGNKQFRALKGVPKKALEKRPNYWVYENLIKTRESMVRKKKPMTLINRHKLIKNIYDKRILYKNGNTEPILINEFIT